MIKLKDLCILDSCEALACIPSGKILINTINAHSYNTAQKDALFAEALKNGDYLIPDGASIVIACRWLNAKSQPKERIAGWDLFVHEMNKVNEELRIKNEELEQPGSMIVGQADEELKMTKRHLTPDREYNKECCGSNNCNNNSSFYILHSSFKLCSSFNPKKKVMFLGSSEEVLEKIRREVYYIYHNLEVVTYSPPYKAVFSDEDNRAMIDAINKADPDLLWIGMTAPKQEKWVYEHWDELDIHCHVGTIGAVFDFFAGTVKRAPKWWQRHGLEWLYRLISEPRRMWRRYLIGNVLFLWYIVREKCGI